MLGAAGRDVDHVGRPGRDAHAFASLRSVRTMRLVSRTRTNEIANSSVATAAASSGLNWFVSWKMRYGSGHRLVREVARDEARSSRIPRGLARTRGAPQRRSPVGSRGMTTARNVFHAERAEHLRGLLLGRVQLEEHRLHRAHDERQRHDAHREQDRELAVDELDARGCRRSCRSACWVRRSPRASRPSRASGWRTAGPRSPTAPRGRGIGNGPRCTRAWCRRPR